LLDRFGVFKRGAAGTSHTVQLIAANVDTLFIVTSANRDFKIARLERYLAIAHDAGAFPVIVITKADTVDSSDSYVRDAAGLSPGLLVEALDARDPGDVARLQPWCGPGQTVALLGSSGVGKSTLINSLAGTRQDDDVFAEISELAASCRFSDCSHAAEPGCAVQAAIAEGSLDAERLRRFRKLLSEHRRNTESVAERRARDRSLGQLYKSILAGKQQLKGGDR
jgi:ribosome biogenesis GTPase